MTWSLAGRSGWRFARGRSPRSNGGGLRYIAHEHIPGLSKLTRLVRLFARRLTVQERIGQQLADALDRILEPHGVAVHLEAVHLCTQMRGVREIESSTRTTYWRGNYDEDPDLRAGFFRLCGQTASAELLTVRRHGSYLFLRYALHGTPPPAEPSGG